MTWFRKSINFAVISLMLLPGGLLAQTSEMARPGPEGIYVFLGKNIPSGKNISAYRIERRVKDGVWKQITEVKTAVTFAEFNSKLEAARALLPAQQLPSGASLESIWQQAKQSGTTDSIKDFRNEYPLRLALGTMYYDADVKNGNDYQYRVTEVNAMGSPLNNLLSNTVQLPYIPVWDAIELSEASLNDKSVYIKWRSAGKSPAPLFMVLTFEEQKPVIATGNTIRYTTKDITNYVYEDSLVKPLTGNLQYFLTPYDNLGNSGAPTEVVVIEKENFGQAFFVNTAASKLSDHLGIKLSWNISRATTVRSIDIYRSEHPDKDFAVLVSLSGKDTTYIDENITPDKVYYYMLQANSNVNNMMKQSNTFFAVAYDPSKPLAPAMVAAIGIKGGVKLFVDVTDARAAGIRIYRNNGLSDTLTAISALIHKADSARIVFTDSGGSVSGRQTYTYAARTESTSYILSDLSNKVTARPLLNVAPRGPASLKAYAEDGMIKLFWENMQQTDPAIAGYRVSRRTENAVKNEGQPFVPIAGAVMPYMSNFIFDSTVVAGKTYSYEIQAVDIDNNSSEIKTRATVTLAEDLPIAPGSVTLINTNEGIHVEWAETIYNGMQSYKLYRYQRGFAPVLVSVIPSSSTEYTDVTALPGELYFYYLTTFNATGKESTRSEEAGITR